MKKNYFLSWTMLCCFALLPFSLNAQTFDLNDFAAGGTDCFGGFGTNVSASETTNDVLEICKDAGAETWAGSSGDATFDFTAGQAQFCMDVQLTAPGDVLLKFELGAGVPDWEQAQTYTGPGFQNICWDLTQMDATGTGSVADGNNWGRIAIFPGFGVQSDICGQFSGPGIDPSIFGGDFGGAATTLYQEVLEVCKGAGAEDWTGAACASTLDLSDPAITEVCVDAKFPGPGTFLLKFELAGNPPNTSWELPYAYTGSGGWETACFDLTQTDAAGNGTLGNGVWDNVVIFPDFGEANTNECYQFNLVSPAPPPVDGCVGAAPISNPNALNDFEGGNCFTGGFGGALTADNSVEVVEICKGSGSETWGGAANEVQVDFTGVTEYCVDVIMPIPMGDYVIKFEIPGNPPGTSWEQAQTYTGNGAWQTLCYDLTLPDATGTGAIAAGNVWDNVVYFPNFGVGFLPADECYQIADANVPAAGFGGFGGVGVQTACNANAEICKPGVGVETWAGASCTQTVDLTGIGEICLDAMLPGPGDVLFKLEGGGNPTWELLASYTGPGWETLCYDLTQPDAAGNGSTAAGNTYDIQVIFPDFNEANTDECYNFDNLFAIPIDCGTDLAVDCIITDITLGAAGVCDPITNDYTQEIIVSYVNAPFLTALDVNGQSFPVTSSPQTIVLTGVSDGQPVDVTVSNSSDPLCCTLTVPAAFTAPAPCFDFGFGCSNIPFVQEDFETVELDAAGGSLFSFGGDGSGRGINNGAVELTTDSDVNFVGFVQQIYIPGGLVSYTDVQLFADIISSIAGVVEFRIESFTPGYGLETGRTDLLPLLNAGANMGVGGSLLGGGADLTSEFYQIVFAATGDLMPASGPIQIIIDNLSLIGVTTRITRTMAGNHFFIENPPASPSIACVYNWYTVDDAGTQTLVATTTESSYNPTEVGTYQVEVVCDDGSYSPCGPIVVEELIDCNGCGN